MSPHSNSMRLILLLFCSTNEGTGARRGETPPAVTQVVRGKAETGIGGARHDTSRCCAFDHSSGLLDVSWSQITLFRTENLDSVQNHKWRHFGGGCLVAKSRLTLGPRGLWPASSSFHGISQARTLGKVAISFYRGSSQPRDGSSISYTSRQILYHWATRQA